MVLTMAKPWLSECSTLPFALWFIKLNWLTRYGFTEHRVFRIWYICVAIVHVCAPHSIEKGLAFIREPDINWYRCIDVLWKWVRFCILNLCIGNRSIAQNFEVFKLALNWWRTCQLSKIQWKLWVLTRDSSFVIHDSEEKINK